MIGNGLWFKMIKDNDRWRKENDMFIIYDMILVWFLKKAITIEWVDPWFCCTILNDWKCFMILNEKVTDSWRKENDL